MPDEPRTIGRYEVRGVLGRGAMGKVYLAFDPLLKRPLAIKTVRESGAELASSLVRFRREAEISARLNHPNIVTVHDVGEDPEAGAYLAMEYVDGLPLDDLIQEGLPTESAIHLLLQGMSALQAAERAGITHRDIKPSNILVTQDGRLKLMDFGVARGDDTRLTRTGQIMGTPSYTAPEALAGQEPGIASDHYAFAVTAFQMLTAELPFESPTIAATLFRIVHEPPVFPEGMSAPVRAVFEKALGKRPEDRYPSLDSFLRDLIGAVDLPGETRARFLAGMAGDAAAEVAQLIVARAEASGSIRIGTTPLATARPSGPPPGAGDLSTQAFPALMADPARMTPGSTVPIEIAPAGPARARRRWIAAAALAAAVVGAAAWGLHPRPFRTDVSSLPEGATVLLEGKDIGRTNLTGVRVPRPGATLRLELDGYEPQEIRLGQGSGPVHVVLNRPRFTVRVVTDPPGATAWLNGVAQGTTPIPELQVPAEGRQELVLRLPDRQEWSRVLVQGDQLPDPIRMVRRLAPQSAPPVARPTAPMPPPTEAPTPAPPVVSKPAATVPAPVPAPASQAKPPDPGRHH